MSIPADLKYTPSHEWVRVEADGTLTVGITHHAQDLLGDMVFIENPAVGRRTLVHEARDRHFGRAFGHVLQFSGFERRRDFVEQRVDAGRTDGAEHGGDVVGGVGDERHGVRGQGSGFGGRAVAGMRGARLMAGRVWRGYAVPRP